MRINSEKKRGKKFKSFSIAPILKESGEIPPIKNDVLSPVRLPFRKAESTRFKLQVKAQTMKLAIPSDSPLRREVRKQHHSNDS